MLRLRGGVVEPALMELARSYNTEKKVCRKSVRQQTDGGRMDAAHGRAAVRRCMASQRTLANHPLSNGAIAMRCANQRGGGGGGAARRAMTFSALAAAFASPDRRPVPAMFPSSFAFFVWRRIDARLLRMCADGLCL